MHVAKWVPKKTGRRCRAVIGEDNRRVRHYYWRYEWNYVGVSKRQ